MTWGKLIRLLGRSFPKATLTASSLVPPYGQHPLKKVASLSTANLQHICRQEGILFINNTPSFVTMSGAPKKDMYRDAIHPSVKGSRSLALNIRVRGLQRPSPVPSTLQRPPPVPSPLHCPALIPHPLKRLTSVSNPLQHLTPAPGPRQQKINGPPHHHDNRPLTENHRTRSHFMPSTPVRNGRRDLTCESACESSGYISAQRDTSQYYADFPVLPTRHSESPDVQKMLGQSVLNTFPQQKCSDPTSVIKMLAQMLKPFMH